MKHERQQIEPLNRNGFEFVGKQRGVLGKVTIWIMMIEMYFDRCLIFFGNLSPPLFFSLKTDRSYLPGD